MNLSTRAQIFKTKASIKFPLLSYEDAVYIDKFVPVIINCNLHGKFTQSPKQHLSSKTGCPTCGRLRATNIHTRTKEDFIKLAKKLSKNRYYFDKVVYLNSKTKVTLTCKLHGDFEITPKHLMQGGGCKECFLEKIRDSQSDFLLKAKRKYGNKYSYTKTKYIKSNQLTIITCKIHGDFLQTPNGHLSGYGCKMCGVKKCIDQLRSNTSEFISKAQKIHRHYLYHDVTYIDANTKVTINCPKHGNFKQLPSVHLHGVGCPACKSSKGEKKISDVLTKLHCAFMRQVRLQNCKNVNHLPFDFGLYDDNRNLRGLIEFQGRQHYMPIERWGGKKNFNEIQRHDTIKKTYCETNDIPLLIIPHTEFNNIEGHLIRFVKSIS